MKFLKVLFIVLATSLVSYAQTSDVFRMISNGIPSFSVVDDSTYTGTVNFQSDLTGKSYLANQVVAGYRLFTSLGQVYRVDSVGATTFSSAELFIVEYNEATSAPNTAVMVYNPDGRETVPDVPFGSTGATAQIGAAVVTYNSSITGGSNVMAGSALTLTGNTIKLGGAQTGNDTILSTDDTLLYSGNGLFSVDDGATAHFENSQWERNNNSTGAMVINVTIAVDVNLPLLPDGTVKIVVNASGDPISIDPIGLTTVDGAQGYTVQDGERVILHYNATDDNWVVLGGNSISNVVAQDSLVDGNVTAWIERTGGSVSTLDNPAAGQYDITLNGGADLEHVSVFGNNTTLNGSNEMIITVDNGTNARSRRVMVQLYDANNNSLVDQQATGTVHTAVVSGAVTTITIPGLNGFGATGFYVEIR